MTHFALSQGIVSVIHWEGVPAGMSGFTIKIVTFYPDGSLPHNEYPHDFGHFIYTLKDGPNLFTTQEDASEVAQLLSEGSENGSETFLVMKAEMLARKQNQTARGALLMIPCGPYYACGKRL